MREDIPLGQSSTISTVPRRGWAIVMVIDTCSKVFMPDCFRSAAVTVGVVKTPQLIIHHNIYIIYMANICLESNYHYQAYIFINCSLRNFAFRYLTKRALKFNLSWQFSFCRSVQKRNL